MANDILWIPGGLIGFKVVTKKKPAKGEEKSEDEISYTEGALMALRKNGDEVLFAYSDEDSRTPMEWISIADFVANPVAIATEDDFYDDQSPASTADIPVDRAASGPRGEIPRRPGTEEAAPRRGGKK